MLTDPISDFLIRLKNASRAEKENFTCPHSKIKENIAKILQSQGYIWNFEVKNEDNFKYLLVKTKFIDKVPALTDLKRVSKPGIRKYVSSKEIPRVIGGMGIAIISTSKGVMTGQKAKREKLGGELLALVW